LITLLLLLSVGAIVWLKAGDSETPTGSAVIYQNDVIIEKIDLNKDQVADLLSGKMRIEVKASRIRVARSDCPKQICVHTGWIKNPREVIVCVPYRVLVEISAPEAPFLDAVVR
jgi:heptaprenyl diphosphate synthase